MVWRNNRRHTAIATVVVVAAVSQPSHQTHPKEMVSEKKRVLRLFFSLLENEKLCVFIAHRTKLNAGIK